MCSPCFIRSEKLSSKPIQSLMSFTAEREYFLCGYRMEELESQCVLNVFLFCESQGLSVETTKSLRSDSITGLFVFTNGL